MKSVRAKLLVTMTAAVALVLVVVMGIAYWQTSTLLRDNAEEKFLLQAQQLAHIALAQGFQALGFTLLLTGRLDKLHHRQRLDHKR